MSNVPDDWGSFYSKCDRCGVKYHDSEGCECDTTCDRCGELWPEEEIKGGLCPECGSCQVCGDHSEDNKMVLVCDFDEYIEKEDLTASDDNEVYCPKHLKEVEEDPRYRVYHLS